MCGETAYTWHSWFLPDTNTARRIVPGQDLGGHFLNFKGLFYIA